MEMTSLNNTVSEFLQLSYRNKHTTACNLGIPMYTVLEYSQRAVIKNVHSLILEDRDLGMLHESIMKLTVQIAKIYQQQRRIH